MLKHALLANLGAADNLSGSRYSFHSPERDKLMKILITAPSLDETENVSGISALVRQIIRRGAATFYHFQAGKRDDERTDAKWLLQQTLLIPRFLNKIRRERIDLVHLNTTLTPLAIGRDFALATAARIARKPILLHLHGGRFLMEDFQIRAFAAMTEKMFRAAKKIVVLSEIEKRSLESRWKNLDIEVLPNAVDVEEALNVEREPDAEKTIIFLGRLHESKGLNEIVEAIQILKNKNINFNFRVFGAGEMKDFFVAEMSKILGAKFFYGGVAVGAEKWKQLAASDIFLLPSRYGEGLPMALLEAMAAGCVVVAADVASIRAVVKDGENGFLVEPYNAVQTADILKKIMLDKTDWDALKKNARSTVEDEYSFNEYIEKLEKIYAEISTK